MKFPSSMSLDETDSSDDSTYSSQYQSDANSTPRTGTSHTLPRNLPRSSGVGATSVVKVKSMTDYETEILQMRSEMEQLQCKLSEAERQLQMNSQDSKSEIMNRLMREEDKLRREMINDQDPMSEKEKMILMQQKKIQALDAANKRLLEELNKLSVNKVSVTTSPINVTSINTSSNTVQQSSDRRISSSSSSSNKSITVITNGEVKTNVSSEGAPKTVDELLDSLHSTSI